MLSSLSFVLSSARLHAKVDSVPQSACFLVCFYGVHALQWTVGLSTHVPRAWLCVCPGEQKKEVGTRGKPEVTRSAPLRLNPAIAAQWGHTLPPNLSLLWIDGRRDLQEKGGPKCRTRPFFPICTEMLQKGVR
eukprot:RCo042520